MQTNRFVELFKRHNWKVEELGENSFVAYNDRYFIPFSCVPCGDTRDMFASAVSYFIEDKEKFISSWREYNKIMRIPVGIGHYAFSNWFIEKIGRRFFHVGGIANHDHSTWEIEQWLIKIER